MAAPHRDKIAKITWSERSYVGPTLLSASDFSGNWWTDPHWAVYNTDGGPWPTGTFFPAAGGDFVYINGWRLGSHAPISEYVEGVYPALAAPGTQVRVRGVFNWSYYSWAVSPDVRIRVYANGQVFNNLPAAFTWEDGFPTYFEIFTDLNGSGDLAIAMKIEDDDGIGSTSLIATLNLTDVVELPCGGLTTDYEVLTPYPLEEVRAYAAPRAGSTFHRLPSGEADAWLLGHDGRLDAELRWIPAVSALALPANDGWEDRDDSGTIRAGWARFLRWAKRGGAFTFYPDKDDGAISYPCVWAGDRGAIETLEADMERAVIGFRIRTTDGSDIEGY